MRLEPGNSVESFGVIPEQESLLVTSFELLQSLRDSGRDMKSDSDALHGNLEGSQQHSGGIGMWVDEFIGRSGAS